MKIALDISSTQSGHQFRGIGFYTLALHKALARLAAKQDDFTLLPFELAKRPSTLQVDLYHWPAFSPFFWSVTLRLIKQSIVTIHDLIPLQFPDHFPAGIRGTIRWQVQRLMLRQARHLITDSIASKRAILQHIGVPDHEVKVIYLGADKAYKPLEDRSQLHDLQKQYRLPKKFVLYIGDLNWNKNVVRLAKTCLDLKYPLVVIGKQATNQNIDLMHPWNGELVQFQRLVHDHPTRIQCLGFVPTQDLVGILNLATLLAHPAHAEGFGLPVLEAMQCGCPVVTSNTSSLPEIVGKAGVLVTPTSKSEIANGLKQVWQSRALRAKLSLQGREQAKRFSWDKTASQVLQVYRNSV